MFKIQNRVISPTHPPLVIAEIGINHEGSLQTAKEMVDAAFRSGVEVVKHQTHIVEDEMSGAAKKVIPGNADVSIYDIMERCALSEADEWDLMQYVQSKGMIFISTPFSRAAANRLQAFDVPAFKIGSGECNNHPLLHHIAAWGKPMIISTGMNDLNSVRKTVEIVQSYGTPVALMHTTNLYPTPDHLVRLGAMQQMIHAFPDIPVGLSDHTLGNEACLAAVALGATILERHFTDHMDRPGPDIVCSMDELACAELIRNSNRVHSMLGGQKKAAQEEQVTIDFAFATLVTIRSIKKGESFSEDNMWVKRPGTGPILAEHYHTVIGKVAATDIDHDTHIDWHHIA